MIDVWVKLKRGQSQLEIDSDPVSLECIDD